MKAFYLIVPLGAALVGCSVYPPIAERVYTPPATVAVSPTYVTPPNAVVLGAGVASPTLIDSDGDGHANAVDRHPHDARFY